MKALLIPLILISFLYSFHEYEKKDDKNISQFDKRLNDIENKLSHVYKKLNYSSKLLDEFLIDEKSDSIYIDSYIRIESSLEKKEHSDIDFQPNIDIKIKLPKLKEKISLTIDNIERKINSNLEDSNETTNTVDENYNIGFLYNTIKKDIDLKFKLGVKASTKPYIYTKAEASKLYDINSYSIIKIAEKLKYSDKDKLDNTTSIQYNYRFDNNHSFINYNEYFINSEEKKNKVYNSIRINQKLPKKRYINYVSSVNSDDTNENFNVKEYRTYISYRKYIRKWLYYDLVPSVTWNRDNSFDENFGMKLNLGIYIGK